MQIGRWVSFDAKSHTRDELEKLGITQLQAEHLESENVDLTVVASFRECGKAFFDLALFRGPGVPHMCVDNDVNLSVRGCRTAALFVMLVREHFVHKLSKDVARLIAQRVWSSRFDLSWLSAGKCAKADDRPFFIRMGTSVQDDPRFADFAYISENHDQVLLATDTQTNDRVAIVSLSVDWKTAEDIPSDVRHVIGLLHRLQHPNVEGLRDAFFHTDPRYTYGELRTVRHYFDWSIVQFVENWDIPTVRMPEPQIALLCYSVIQGLLFLRERGLLFRKFTVDSVFVNSITGRIALQPYVSDFVLERSRRITVVGTPYWLAPEVIRGDPSDYSLQMSWAIGVMLLEVCMGEPLNMELPPARALFYTATKGSTRFPEEDSRSSEFLDFYDKCMTFDPNARFPLQMLEKHNFLDKRCDEKAFAEFSQRTIADVRANRAHNFW